MSNTYRTAKVYVRSQQCTVPEPIALLPFMLFLYYVL